NPLKTGPFSNYGYIAVHFAINLNAFYHLLSVGFQSTIEIVEIPYSGHAAGNRIEKFGGDSFTWWVVPLLFPTGDQIDVLLRDLSVQFGNLIRTILEVGIHGNNDVSLRSGESYIKCGRLAVIATEFDGTNLWVHRFQPFYDLPGVVRTAVIDKNHLVAETVIIHHTSDPSGKLRQRFSLVV